MANVVRQELGLDAAQAGRQEVGNPEESLKRPIQTL